jgi:hypothetical protein
MASVAYNFQTGNNKTELLMEYENVTQKVLFRSARRIDVWKQI